MSSPAALRRRLSRRGSGPSWGDGLLFLVLVVPPFWSTRGGGGSAAPLLGAGVGATLLWRRRAPVPAFAVAWLFAAIQGLFTAPTFSDAALLVDLYTIGVTASRRTTVVAWAVLEAGCVIAAIKFGGPNLHREIASFLGLSGMGIAALVIGVNVGNRRQMLAGLRERAERLEREREQEVALARVTERSRIAREMHDVIAHNLSVMIALCDGAAYHVQDDPDRAESALGQASRTGRQALSEMRRLLGVLREAPDQPDLAPQPGVRQLESLIDQVRAAGLPVSYAVTGQLRDASPAIELAIYRIVQEALTNTLKHAGPGVSASVALTCTPGGVDIDVRDTGTSRATGHGRGSGLRGMRERAAVYGGTLEAGPAPEGGWRVHTTLAMPTAVAAS